MPRNTTSSAKCPWRTHLLQTSLATLTALALAQSPAVTATLHQNVHTMATFCNLVSVAQETRDALPNPSSASGGLNFHILKGLESPSWRNCLFLLGKLSSCTSPGPKRHRAQPCCEVSPPHGQIWILPPRWGRASSQQPWRFILLLFPQEQQ